MNPLYSELLKYRTHLSLISTTNQESQDLGIGRSTINTLKNQKSGEVKISSLQNKVSEKKIRPAVIRKQSIVLIKIEDTLVYLNQALSFLQTFQKTKPVVNILLLTKIPVQTTIQSTNIHIWNTKWVGGSITNKNHKWIWSTYDSREKEIASPDLVIVTHPHIFSGALAEAKSNQIPCIIYDENILNNQNVSSFFLIPGNTQSPSFIIWSLNILLSALINEQSQSSKELV